MELKPGQIWRHYKGDTYKIITIGKLEATQEEMVVYERQTDIAHTGWRIWIRPISLFQESVEWQGQTVARFTFVSDN